MPAGSFRASDVVWQSEARCLDAGFDFVPYSETEAELGKVQATFCNPCPVRTECLAYALLYRMSGYWGGTSTAERRKLSVPRDRVKCPSCTSRAVVRMQEGHDICQHCGVSWTAARPRLPEEAAG